MELDLSVINWVAVSAVATLIVAITAFITLRSSNKRTTRLINEARDKEQREKDERLLKEVIDWAFEVLSHGSSVNNEQFVKDLTHITRELTKDKLRVQDLQYLEWGHGIDKTTSILVTQKKGLYINKITDKYFKDLSPTVEAIRQALLHRATLLCGLTATSEVGKELETAIAATLAELEKDELLKEVLMATSEEKEYDEEEQAKRKIELGKKLHNNWTSVKSFAEDLIDKSVSLLEEPIIK